MDARLGGEASTEAEATLIGGNFSIVAATCLTALTALAAKAQTCTGYLYGSNSGGSIGIMCSSSCPPATATSAAISMWNGCGSSGGGFATLRNNTSGTFNVRIVLGDRPNGTEPVNVTGCGWFDANLNGTVVVGGTIHVYSFRKDGSSCEPLDKTIAHEIGHVLGLSDSQCNDTHIMSPRPSGATDTRYVHGDECSAVDNHWTTPTEAGTGGGGTGHDPYVDTCGTPEGCSPLVLDLDGNGIATSGGNDPVVFDLDGNGSPELLTWLGRGGGDAFLWIDINNNRTVDDGRELLGVGTILPDGRKARDGFEALKIYDQPENGGNGDGIISAADHIWGTLRLWVDVNHDGLSDASEIMPIQSSSVVYLGLAYTTDGTPDEYGNLHLLRGTYVRRERGAGERLGTYALEDIVFHAP